VFGLNSFSATVLSGPRASELIHKQYLPLKFTSAFRRLPLKIQKASPFSFFLHFPPILLDHQVLKIAGNIYCLALKITFELWFTCPCNPEDFAYVKRKAMQLQN
jgi:hypothetical protein